MSAAPLDPHKCRFFFGIYRIFSLFVLQKNTNIPMYILEIPILYDIQEINYCAFSFVFFLYFLDRLALKKKEQKENMLRSNGTMKSNLNEFNFK